MFEIDLLKGKARPYKPSPKRLAATGVLLAIPLITTMVYASGLLSERAALAATQHTVADYQAQLDRYAEDVQFLLGQRRQIDAVSLSVNDIGQGLRYRQIASDILTAIAQELPETIVLHEMNLQRTGRRDRNTDATGTAWYETTVQRGLTLMLGGDLNSDSDAVIQQYIDRLKTSPALSERVAEVRTAARQQRVVRDKEMTLYTIEITFKDQR